VQIMPDSAIARRRFLGRSPRSQFLRATVDAVAALVLSLMLRSPRVAQHLPTSIKQALASLHEYAARTESALQELIDLGHAIECAIPRALACHVLRPDAASFLEVSQHRFARFRDFLDAIGDAAAKVAGTDDPGDIPF